MWVIFVEVGSAGQPSSSGSGVANGTLDNGISKVVAYSVGKDIDEKTYEWDSSYYNWIEIISD